MLVAAWRARLSGRHALWSSPLLLPSAEQPLTLAEMALPLRVTSRRGGEQVLGAGDVAGRKTVVVGPAGSGKSTLLKLLFGELISLDDCLPILLDLRDLRARPSLDAWITEELQRLVPELVGVPDPLRRVAAEGPRPMLLLDGWDELGESGNEINAQLVGLVRALPQIDVVASTRPVARGLPSEAQGFQALQLQPFDDRDLDGLVDRLLAVCVQAGRRSETKARFLASLEASEPARALARRPLLLQMMLLLIPNETLPERRHRLYAECIDALLLTRTTEDDLDERLAALAGFAWRMQQIDTVDPESALPPSWTSRKRRAFVEWLCGDAGLLERTGPGALRFLHPALREYLAALHLSMTVGSPQRGETARELARDPRSWEVLRLWLAVLAEPDAARLVRDLEADSCLIGAIHSDGLGREQDFESWCRSFQGDLVEGWPRRIGVCTQSWASSSARARRIRLAEVLLDGVETTSWDAWLRVSEVVLDADLGVELPDPITPRARHLLAAVRGDCSRPESVALGRVLAGGSPLWPGVLWEVSLLQAWPSRRVAWSRWLQRLASLGADEATLAAARPPLVCRDQLWWEGLLSEWTGFVDDHGTYRPAEHWAHRLALTDPRAPDPLDGDAVIELLADTRTPSFAGGVVSLIRSACRARLGQGELAPDDTDEPLWAALARVLAGCSQPGDVELLEDLARHPEKRSGPLSWGLQYVVRGDIWLDTDRILRLEDLGLSLPLVDA
ncbi:MAG TPA: NACHT domain-containing protein [Myxococcota bacterium]|nr:NACHT domain-containing protein [Myxococcota bacterium]